MKMVYILDDLFIYKSKTRQGYPFIFAGSAPLENTAALCTGLEKKLSELVFSGRLKAKKIDISLAEIVKLLEPKPDVMGLSIKIPKTIGRGGGIVGNPQNPATPAQGLVEEAAANWRCICFPGGPGILYERTEGVENMLLSEMQRVISGEKDILQVSGFTLNLGIKKVMVLTDGSGRKAKGLGLIRSESRYITLAL